MLRHVVHGYADLRREVADALLAVAHVVQDRLAVLVGERLAELGVHAVHGASSAGEERCQLSLAYLHIYAYANGRSSR